MSNASHHSSPTASASAGASINNVLSNDRQEPTKEERTRDARRLFLSALSSASKELDTDLQLRGKMLHENANELIKQEQKLHETSKELTKENEEAQQFLEESQKRLAEFDDLEELDVDLEDELADLEVMLDLMEAKEKRENRGSETE